MGTVTTESDAHHLAHDLHAAGVETFIRRGKLALSPASRLTPDLRRRVAEHPASLLAKVLAEDPASRDAVGLTAARKSTR